MERKITSNLDVHTLTRSWYHQWTLWFLNTLGGDPSKHGLLQLSWRNYHNNTALCSLCDVSEIESVRLSGKSRLKWSVKWSQKSKEELKWRLIKRNISCCNFALDSCYFTHAISLQFGYAFVRFLFFSSRIDISIMGVDN